MSTLAELEFLPETPGEITPAWLTEALGQTVTDLSQEDLGDGVGFMGDILRVDLTGEGLPDSVVIKLPKKANRVMGEMLGVYEREIMFFQEFGNTVPLRIPEVYFSQFDRDKGSENQAPILEAIDKMPLFLNKLVTVLGTLIAGAKKRRYMLVIEYLDGMAPGDQLAGLGTDGCEQVLCEIAALHSQYWDSPAIGDHFWLLPLDIDARLRHGMFMQHAEQFLSWAPASLSEKVEWLKPRGVDLMREFVANAPTTLLHCDLRLDNVLFDGERCAFIDWQLVRKGPAAYDVAYFMTSALHEEAGADDVDRILRTYHQKLNRPDYSVEQLRADYSRALLLILSNLSSVDDVELGDGRGKTMMDAWIRRLAARLDEIDLKELRYK